MDESAEVPKQRSKTPARIYYSVILLVCAVLLLDCVISLGSFGVIQHRVNNFQTESNNTCILYGTYAGEFEDYTAIDLSHIGSCAFVLWGQVTIVIIALGWMFFYVFQSVAAPRILSMLRLLDVAVMGLSTFLALALSITVSAGLSRTCSAFDINVCSLTFLISRSNPDDKLYYYNGINSAQSSLWVATCMFLALTIFNSILMIAFCRRARKRREVNMTKFQDEDDPETPLKSDKAAAKKMDSPFSKT